MGVTMKLLFLFLISIQFISLFAKPNPDPKPNPGPKPEPSPKAKPNPKPTLGVMFDFVRNLLFPTPRPTPSPWWVPWLRDSYTTPAWIHPSRTRPPNQFFPPLEANPFHLPWRKKKE